MISTRDALTWRTGCPSSGIRRGIPVIAVLLACSFGAVEHAVGQTLEVDPVVLRAEQQRIEAMARATRAAVAVFDVGDPGGGGSAVVISSDGYALTNYHVVEPVGAHMKCGMQDGRLYDAVLVGIDPTGDVALIQLQGRDDFPMAETGDSDTVQVGDWCFAVGNPFLLAHDFRPTVTYGIVSGVHRYQEPAGTLLEYADCIQTDAAINPGNSGGPLFDLQGELIGINGRGSFEKRNRVNVGVGYAISINQIVNFLGHLKSGRVVDHATWGATVTTDEDGRVVVTNILPSSDAYRRGIRYGDQIVSFGGRDVNSANDLKNVLGTFPEGWRIGVTYLRDEKVEQVYVRLDGVHAREQLLEMITPRQVRRGRGPGRRDGDSPREDRPSDAPQGDEDTQRQPDAEPRSDAEEAQEPQDADSTVRSVFGEVLPPVIAEVYQQRRGYTNYYFNRLHQQRLWTALSQSALLEGADGVWNLAGRDDLGAVWALQLTDERVNADFAGMRLDSEAEENAQQRLFPEGSGGAVWAMQQWRRLLVRGPERFGDLYYLGREPLPGTSAMVDVLVGTADLFETRFGFDSQTGQLIVVSFSADASLDRCEISLSDYRRYGRHQLPRQWEIRWGDKLYGTLTLETFSAGSSEVPEPAAPAESRPLSQVTETEG